MNTESNFVQCFYKTKRKHKLDSETVRSSSSVKLRSAWCF